jgi:Domain of unknown function (DUF4160)
VPTIFEVAGCRVAIYTNDHRPSHVHVTGAERWAIFFLNCPHGPVRLRENGGFTKARINALAKAIEAELQRCCAEWERIHGNF